MTYYVDGSEKLGYSHYKHKDGYSVSIQDRLIKIIKTTDSDTFITLIPYAKIQYIGVSREYLEIYMHP